MSDETVNTNPASDAGQTALTDGSTKNSGTTPPGVIGSSRSGLKPGDPGYEPPAPIAGDRSGSQAIPED